MSETRKIEPNKTYFLTFTIVDWIDLFTRECFVNILVESLQYCQKLKGLEIYSYVILPSHLHMIASREGSLSPVLRDLKGHTSKEFIKEIKSNNKESRREWLMDRFTLGYEDNKPRYRVWREGNYPVELHSNKFFNQKAGYIHQNPVRMGMVSKPEHYKYSSASEDSPIKVIAMR